MQRYVLCPQIFVMSGVIVIEAGAAGTFKAVRLIFNDFFMLLPHAEV